MKSKMQREPRPAQVVRRRQLPSVVGDVDLALATWGTLTEVSILLSLRKVAVEEGQRLPMPRQVRAALDEMIARGRVLVIHGGDAPRYRLRGAS